MSRPKSVGENLVDWQLMVDGLVPYLATLPHLADDAGALGAVVARSRELENEVSLAEAHLRAIHQERREAAREGRKLRNRLAAGICHALGFENPKLVEFRIKPRPEKRRRTGLTAVQKAQRAADRAVRKAAELEAKNAKRSAVRIPPS